MQPLHSLEARWFFQWDGLELARGLGYSFFLAGAIFLAAGPFVHFPSWYAERMAALGVLLFASACIMDLKNGPVGKRAIACRCCKARSTIAKAQARGWKCGKCKSAGRFDNLPG